MIVQLLVLLERVLDKSVYQTLNIATLYKHTATSSPPTTTMLCTLGLSLIYTSLVITIMERIAYSNIISALET